MPQNVPHAPWGGCKLFVAKKMMWHFIIPDDQGFGTGPSPIYVNMKKLGHRLTITAWPLWLRVMIGGTF